MRVIVVDDQPDVVTGIRDGLNWKELGVSEVLTATSAAAARKQILEGDVDILLCDIEMPRENGLALLSSLRDAGSQIVTIFLTSHAEFSYAQEALRLGSIDYVLQPAPYKEIEQALAKAIAQVEAEQALRKADEEERQAEEAEDAQTEESDETAPSFLDAEDVSLDKLRLYRWESYLENGREQRIAERIAAFFAEHPNPSEALLQVIFWRYNSVLVATAKKNEIDYNAFFGQPDGLRLEEYLSSYRSAESLLAAVRFTAGAYARAGKEEHEDGEEDVIRQVITYIDEHLEDNLSRAELAELVHLNEDYLTRLLKKQTGYGLKEYITNERMIRAKELLKNTNLSVSLIAVKSGFTNFSYFSQLFRKEVGMTPNEYRQHE